MLPNDIEQSFAVNPSLQIQEPLTHFPLNEQSFGHILWAMSDKMEELESPWLLSSLSLEYDERFLPTIWPQLFRRTDIAEIAKVGSLVAWKQNKHTELVDRWSPYCHFLIEKIKYIDITQSIIDNILPNTNTVNIARIYLIGLFSKISYENL